MKIKDRGDLDRSVIIESLVETTNSMNEIIDTWVTLKTVWAAYDPGSRNEEVSSEREVNTDVVEFGFSYESVSDIYLTMPKLNRLDYGGRKYDILSFEELGRRQFIVLKCRHAS